jgi:anthranilate phosphoribosyltransferase
VTTSLLLAAAGLARDFTDGYEQALSVIVNGRALEKVEELREDTPCRQHT